MVPIAHVLRPISMIACSALSKPIASPSSGKIRRRGGNLRLDRHLAKVRTLAEGWASAGRYHGDEGVLNRATIDLANTLDHYHADSPRPGA